MSILIRFLAAVAVSATTVAAYTGDMTWFYPGLGACGWTNNDGEAVVALSPSEFSGNCGKYILIESNGRYTAGRVVDLCPGCASGSIDVSPAIFDDIADLGVGRTRVNWSFK